MADDAAPVIGRQVRGAPSPTLRPTPEERLLVRADLLHVDLVEAGVQVGLDGLQVPLWIRAAGDLLGHASRGTNEEASAKSCGRGRVWASCPGSSSLGHSRAAVSSTSCTEDAQHTFIPPCSGRDGSPFLRNSSTSSGSGEALQYPSPMRAASSVACGPNPET